MQKSHGNLCLTRKNGESIQIGKDVEITVLKINKNNEVSFAIRAPKHIKILRSELETNNE